MLNDKVILITGGTGSFDKKCISLSFQQGICAGKSSPAAPLWAVT